ncbi:MAG: site-2 protease family protein [Candidatus Poribacteria bacterium]|nr:site-2 protease family protein [Candidatus Poribacteria bacterium]
MKFDPFFAIIAVSQFIVLLTFHEWGHAKSANLLGDSTAEDEGRMTFNPAAHIDPLGTIILPLLGTLFGGAFFGWAKPVPVDPRNLKNPKRDLMFIAAAGPIMNIICTVVILGIVKILEETVGFPQSGSAAQYQIRRILLFRSAQISLWLATFNMLPLFPLDGFSVVLGLLPWKQAQEFERLRPYGMPILMAIIFLPGLLRIPNPVFSGMGIVVYGIYGLIRTLVGLG